MKTRIKAPSAIRFVFDGQSMNMWPPLGWLGGKGPFPNVLMREYPDISWANIAIGDTGWGVPGPPANGLSASISTRRNTQIRQEVGLTDILIMSGGQGDVYSPTHGGQTGAQAHARSVVYANSARAAGFDKIIATSWPQLGPGGSVVIDQEDQDTFNSLLMTNYGSFFDGVVNWHSGILSDASNTTYFESDRVHVTNASIPYMVSQAKVVVDNVLATL